MDCDKTFLYIYQMKIKVLEIDQEMLRDSISTKEKEKRFYIYIHRKISNNEPFYIGKGTKYRCLDFNSRTEYWKRTANKHGVYVQIYKNKLTNEEALELEKELISKIGIKKLTNFSLGGDSGLVGKLNHFFGKRFYKESNGNWMNRGIKNPLSETILRFDLNNNFIKKYYSSSEVEQDGFSPSTVIAVCKGRRKQHKGSFFIKEKEYNKEKDYTVKQSINDKKKIDCFDLDGNYLRTYNSINETKSDGFSPKNVQSVCKGRKKTHLKHVFKYHNKI